MTRFFSKTCGQESFLFSLTKQFFL